MRSAPSSIGMEMGVGRGRHDTGFRDSTLANLARLPIQTDSETDRHAWSATTRLTVRHRLTLYEAAYLGAGVAAGFALGHTRS